MARSISAACCRPLHQPLILDAPTTPKVVLKMKLAPLKGGYRTGGNSWRTSTTRRTPTISILTIPVVPRYNDIRYSSLASMIHGNGGDDVIYGYAVEWRCRLRRSV